MQWRALELIAAACLAIAAAFASTHAGNAQTPALDCAPLSSLLDDGTPLGLALQAPAVRKVEPSQGEAACRAALQADPIDPTVMFQLARALVLASKQLQAIKYYLDAADRGHAGAMNDLGALFEYGIGVPKNLSTAIEWYQSAAGHGHTGAMAHLGQLNENGEIAQDLDAAKDWYEKAARLGNVGAMSSLARLLREAGDPVAAASWYKKAAEQGLASAMNALGGFSQAGMGVRQDYGSARQWYRNAAELGDADAMANLGALFESGRGGPQNLQVAREWYVRGAALKGRAAMHNLGAMLENGRGTSKNLSEARFWYERAAAFGYPPALNALGRLHLAGAGVAKNYARANSLFEQAAALGDAKAMNNLGVLYLDGRGVSRDIKVARAWFERAVALGNTEAQANLKRLDEAGLSDGTQIAARRASCAQTCAELHKSYANSVCEGYSSTADGDKSERTKCIGAGLTLARHCRATCREWAPTLVSDNKCLSCFRSLIACSINRQPTNAEAAKTPFAVDSSECLESLSDCMSSCGKANSPSELAN